MTTHATTANPGSALAFGAALGYCLQNVGVRALLDGGGISVWGILFTRGLMGLVVVALAARLFHVNVFGKNRRLLALIGLFGAASSACSTMAFSMIPLYQALVLLYLYPALSVPLNLLVNRTRIRQGDGLLVLAAFAGCALLIWPDETTGLSLSMGHLIGCASAVLYSLAYVCIARLGEDNSGLEPLCYYSFWAVIGVGVGMLVSGHNAGLGDPGLFVSGLGVGLLALAALLMGYAALRWIEPYKVGTIGMLEVFGGALSSWLLFHDPMSPRAVLGGLVILVAALRLRRA